MTQLLSNTLTDLDISGCTSITKQSVMMLSKCVNLITIDFTGINAQTPQNLSLDAALVILAQGCSGLKRFRWDICPQLNNECVCFLADLCEGLESFSANQNARIGGAAIEALSFLKLRSLSVRMCPQIPSTSFTTFLTAQRGSLVSLDVSCNQWYFLL